MAYQIKVWKDGEVIYEEWLNHMEEGIAEAHRIAEAANSAASNSEHAKNKNNPHEVTAKQIGLGNVPNVSTNDQTPTYTEASQLAKLSSGEKLSAAFSKIAKAVTDIIAHLANKENPHSVTKKQLDIDKVPNVTTNDQTPTYTQASALANLSSGEKLSVAFGKISKAVASIITHLSSKNNPHDVTASQIGLATWLNGNGYSRVTVYEYSGNDEGVIKSLMDNTQNITEATYRTIVLPFIPSMILVWINNTGNTYSSDNIFPVVQGNYSGTYFKISNATNECPFGLSWYGNEFKIAGQWLVYGSNGSLSRDWDSPLNIAGKTYRLILIE